MRPKNWKNPYYEAFNKSSCTERVPFEKRDKGDAFEAGADAILQCLKRQQVTVPDILYWWITAKGRKECKKGYLVFIPDEETP